MTNRTSDVDLQNYLSNGEWELLDASLVREEITYSLSAEPFTHVTVSIKSVTRVLVTFPHLSPLVFQDTEEDSVLHVQHCLPLHDDVHPHGACLLYAPGLRLFRSPGHTSYSLMIICRGENCSRSDGYFSIFSIYVGHS